MRGEAADGDVWKATGCSSGDTAGPARWRAPFTPTSSFLSLIKYLLNGPRSEAPGAG